VTLAELIVQFRQDAFDEVAPYAFSDAKVTAWINEAEEEAALRADLLHESEDADLCEIAVTAGTQKYTLHAKWARITKVFWQAEDAEDEDRYELDIIKRTVLDASKPAWRTTEDEPRAVVIEARTLRLDCIPASDGTIYLEGFRMPLEAMAQDADEPEIAEAHHRHIVDWALSRAFDVPDTEIYNEKRAERALANFTRHFGEPLSADMLRDTESETIHVKAW